MGGKFDLRIDTSKIDIYSGEPQQLDRDVARVIQWFNGIRERRRERLSRLSDPLVIKRVTKGGRVWRNYRYEGAWLTFAAKNLIWRELIDMGYVLMNLGKVIRPVATSFEGVRMDSQVRRTTPPQVFSERHISDLEFPEKELLPDNYAEKSDVISTKSDVILGTLATERLRLGYHVSCIVHPDKPLMKLRDRWACSLVTCGFSFKEPRSDTYRSDPSVTIA